MSLWKKGKLETQLYYDLKLKKATDFKAFIFGILLTLIVLLPAILVLVQVFKVYIYHPVYRIILVLIGLMMIMLANGLSNMFMVRLSKFYFPENPNLAKIDEKAILMYHTFNVGFLVFIIILVIVLGVI